MGEKNISEEHVSVCESRCYSLMCMKKPKAFGNCYNSTFSLFWVMMDPCLICKPVSWLSPDRCTWLLLTAASALLSYLLLMQLSSAFNKAPAFYSRCTTGQPLQVLPATRVIYNGFFRLFPHVSICLVVGTDGCMIGDYSGVFWIEKLSGTLIRTQLSLILKQHF